MTRNTKLNGKANIYFKKLSKKKIQLRVNIKYILTVSGTQGYMTTNYRWTSSPYSYSVNFSTGEVGLSDRGGETPSCISKGTLENLFLDMI
jgi:hypothetical protein